MELLELRLADWLMRVRLGLPSRAAYGGQMAFWKSVQ